MCVGHDIARWGLKWQLDWYNNNNDRLTAFDPGQPG